MYGIRAFCAGNVVRLFDVDTQQVIAQSGYSSRDTNYYDMGGVTAVGTSKEKHIQLQFYKYPPTTVITWDCYQSKRAYRSITRTQFATCTTCAKRKPWDVPSLECLECMR